MKADTTEHVYTWFIDRVFELRKIAYVLNDRCWNLDTTTTVGKLSTSKGKTTQAIYIVQYRNCNQFDNAAQFFFVLFFSVLHLKS